MSILSAILKLSLSPNIKGFSITTIINNVAVTISIDISFTTENDKNCDLDIEVVIPVGFLEPLLCKAIMWIAIIAIEAIGRKK